MRPCEKNELYNLVLPLKSKEKAYKIDRMLETYGHALVRLPPYMCDLNLIELAWAKMKRSVRENNVTGDLSLQKLLVTEGAVALVIKEDWEGFCRHMETVEKQYFEKDGIVSEVIDGIVIINLSPGSYNDSDCVNSDADPRCECDGSETDITPDEDSDMEFAQPL
jgi:hypothetical protein